MVYFDAVQSSGILQLLKR